MAKKIKREQPTQDKSILNETGRRNGPGDRRQRVDPCPTSERRKTPRRRQIDPTTCEREYTEVEIEFMHALDDYKRSSGRMFPTCSEILEVLQKLGYRKVIDASPTSDNSSICPPVTVDLTTAANEFSLG